MIKYCLDKWNQNRNELENNLWQDKTINDCECEYLVKKIVTIILNGGEERYGHIWDANNITVIDDGDYQGVLLFAIHEDVTHPNESDYLITFVNCCIIFDALREIRELQVYGGEQPTEQQINGYMALCKYIVFNMVKPYNYGLGADPEFETVEI